MSDMDERLIEELSEAVHVGWMAEKVKQGFADHVWPADSGYTVTGLKDGVPMMQVRCKQECGFLESKHHTDMLPYADLAEHVKEYDRATVRAVLTAIAAGGYTIVIPWRPIDDHAFDGGPIDRLCGACGQSIVRHRTPVRTAADTRKAPRL